MSDVEAPLYAQRLRPTGGDIAFKLVGDTLLVERMHRQERVPLSSIVRLRLTYEVGTFGRPIFRTTLRLANGRKLTFTNVSWQGIGSAMRLDAPYKTFVAALAAALGARGCFLEGGRGRVSWLVFATMTLLIVTGVAFFAAHAAFAGASGVAFVGVFTIGWAVIQLGPLVMRNRPCVFAPDAVPKQLMP